MRATLLLTAALLAVACSPSPGPRPPSIEGAWIREAPPGASMTAGYMTVENPGGKDIELIEVRSDDFESIELHVTVTEDGVARMRREDSVVVSAGGSVEFAPGGRHLMLFGQARPLTEGDSVQLVIGLSDGTELRGTAAVVRGGHDHHDH
jgi:copper(I)-binding protein